MKIEKEYRDDHQVKLTVEIESERLEEMKRRAAAKISRKVKLPGFRPGKAPYAVIVRQVGEGAILEEAIEALVEDVYPSVIKEADISAYGPGQLENVSSMDPLTLEFIVPLEAEVQLGDYHSVQKAYEPREITETEIDNVLRDLRERQAVILPVERPAQAGDMVNVMISGNRVNAEDGGEEILLPERSYPIIIPAEGEKENDEWPFPGFSDNLVGLVVGDEKEIEYTFPEDSVLENLRSTTAIFHIKVEDVKARTLPEIDDEFAKSIGDYGTLDELRQKILESLRRDELEEYNREYDDEIIKQGIELSSFKYPPQMLEREIDEVIHNLEHRLEHQNMTLDLYLKTRELDRDAFRKEVEPVAENRLKRGLFLMELGKAEEIKITPEELEREATMALNYLHQSMEEKEARRLFDREIQSNIVGSVLAELMTTKSIRRFRKISGGVPETDEDEGEEQTIDEAAGTETSPIDDLTAAEPERMLADDLPETENTNDPQTNG